MKLSAENYTPQITLKDIKKQAIKAWTVGFSIVFVWVCLILLAPIAEASGLNSISGPIYKFFSVLCHQIPERSFHVENHAFAVCTRCFGVYFGLLLGFIVYPFFRSIEEIKPLPRFWLFLALIPMGIDWSLGFFEIWENTALSRFATGLILGITCAIFIVPAIVELGRLLSSKTQVKRLSR
ncbi:MAG TPA: DUF2085 domain-containing protein [Pyrinomonadaceae bacterium]